MDIATRCPCSYLCVRPGIAFLPHFQKASHLPHLSPSPLSGRGTVSILALSRIQREEMSSDAAAAECIPTGKRRTTLEVLKRLNKLGDKFSQPIRRFL